MSKYTTEIRFICEQLANKDFSSEYTDVSEIIEIARTKIFSFKYPIFDENYRSVLETKILKHFYTREIGYETYGLWKLKLDTKLNEIMPYFNKLYESELLEFNPFYTTHITTKHQGNRQDTGKRDSSSHGAQNNTAEHINLYSDTPQGGVNGINNENYLTNVTKDTDKQNSSINNSSNENNTLTSTDSYIDTVNGYNGYDGSKLLKSFRDTFLNIDMSIINELEELFFQLW